MDGWMDGWIDVSTYVHIHKICKYMCVYARMHRRMYVCNENDEKDVLDATYCSEVHCIHAGEGGDGVCLCFRAKSILPVSMSLLPELPDALLAKRQVVLGPFALLWGCWTL